MSNEDLSNLLNSFTISSNEEKITKQLDQTHIGSTSGPSIFTLPTQPQQPTPSPIAQNWNSTQDTPPQEEDGWGEAPPSYTAISQGTFFGFNSIMEPKLQYTNINNNSSTSNTTAFDQYKNKPVSFISILEENNVHNKTQ